MINIIQEKDSGSVNLYLAYLFDYENKGFRFSAKNKIKY